LPKFKNWQLAINLRDPVSEDFRGAKNVGSNMPPLLDEVSQLMVCL